MASRPSPVARWNALRRRIRQGEERFASLVTEFRDADVGGQLQDQSARLEDQFAQLRTQSDLLAEVRDALVRVDGALARVNSRLRAAREVPSTALLLRERAVEDAVDHIVGDRRFDDLLVATSNADALVFGLDAVTLDGTVAEFGVFQGRTLTAIARHFEDRVVHGFDSFEGLPEAWGGTSKGEGAFDVGGQPPDLPVDNVEFHVGYFDQTVPGFAARDLGPLAFCHLDADLYASTSVVFDGLRSWFVPGTVIVFDEYFGYHGWRRHEHAAFMEFLDASGLDYEAIGIGHMSLVVRLVEG